MNDFEDLEIISFVIIILSRQPLLFINYECGIHSLPDKWNLNLCLLKMIIVSVEDDHCV